MTHLSRALGLATLAALTACSRDMQLQERTVTPVLTTGGTARSADAHATLTFAAGALRDDTEITIVTRRDRTADDLRSFVYELEPSGLTFSAAVELAIVATRADETLAIANLDGPAPVIVEGSTWDPATRTVRAPLAHFSSYGAVAVYNPCAGRVCGEACTICEPGVTGCTEPAPAAKACNRSLLCVAETAAMCDRGDGGEASLDAGPAPDAIPFPGDLGVKDNDGHLDANVPDGDLDANVPDGDLDANVPDGDLDDVTTATLACAEMFRQHASPVMDILLVVDNSCSMAEEQATLAADFGLLLDTLTQNNVDFHLGVTSTDLDNASPGDQGTLVPNPTVLTSTTPNLAATFAQHVSLGVLGSALEQGLDAMRTALSPRRTSGANAGFLREHSGLAIIFVTDEDDQSPLPMTDYEQALAGLREPGHVQVNAIVGDSPLGCPTGLAGDRYLQLQAMTQGAFSSICSPPWTAALTDLGGPSFGYRTRFQLTTGSGGVQAVSVNGVAVPEVGSNGARNWTFDAATRTLTFSEIAVPEPDAAITVFTGC